MTLDTHLTALGSAIGLPYAFAHWCATHGLYDLPAFLHADISRGEDGPERLWSQVQVAVRQARHLAEAGEGDKARATVEHLLTAPAFRRQISQPKVRAAALVKGLRPAGQHSARQELARMGGVAGARHIAARLTQRGTSQVSVRQVRDRFRNTRGAVRKLGGGYYALRDHPALPLCDWVSQYLRREGPTRLDELTSAILTHYPHGDRRAVVAWLHQDPGALHVREGRVSLAAAA